MIFDSKKIKIGVSIFTLNGERLEIAAPVNKQSNGLEKPERMHFSKVLYHQKFRNESKNTKKVPNENMSVLATMKCLLKYKLSRVSR